APRREARPQDQVEEEQVQRARHQRADRRHPARGGIEPSANGQGGGQEEVHGSRCLHGRRRRGWEVLGEGEAAPHRGAHDAAVQGQRGLHFEVEAAGPGRPRPMDRGDHAQVRPDGRPVHEHHRHREDQGEDRRAGHGRQGAGEAHQ
ncbi:unnamed protein product, partial [Prorocentrum cordatum]